METKENKKQSDALRARARSIEYAVYCFIAAVVIYGAYILARISKAPDVGEDLGLLLIVAAASAYLVVALVRAKVEYYKAQADILDILARGDSSKLSAN